LVRFARPDAERVQVDVDVYGHRTGQFKGATDPGVEACLELGLESDACVEQTTDGYDSLIQDRCDGLIQDHLLSDRCVVTV
jgi:hypothetical protein